LILNVRGKGVIEYYAFALTDMLRYGYTGLRGISGQVGEEAVRGIPAIHRAARIRAEALGALKLRCWQGEGPDKKRMDGTWQAKLFAGPPNEWQTRFGFWETVAESLAYRGNAYIWKLVDPASQRIVDWYALHPNQVTCKGAGQYEVKVSAGYMDPVGRGPGTYRVDYDTILHIRGFGQGGMEEAPSPIAVFRDALAAPVERQRHEARMWRRGTSLQLAVEFPQGVSKEQVDEWRPAWQESYEGTDGDTTAVLGGGAKIVPIGMTAVDARFVEMAHLTVEDASRIMGVPANLLGAPTMTGTTKPTLEEDLMTWLRFGLGPEIERIESALQDDDILFPPLGRSIYPSFDTEAFVRGDIMTEATVLQQRVQSGILLPDEARRILGYPPLPGGVGSIPQITPVGGAPNPSLNGKGGQAPPEPALEGAPV
jgi:HK97 family phage portal protein